MFDCYSDRFEEEKFYQVNCNATDNEFRLKIPKEGTKKCVQVSYVIANLKHYRHCYLFLVDFFSLKPEKFLLFQIEMWYVLVYVNWAIFYIIFFIEFLDIFKYILLDMGNFM